MLVTVVIDIVARDKRHVVARGRRVFLKGASRQERDDARHGDDSHGGDDGMSTRSTHYNYNAEIAEIL